jgi:hypothetical protein
VKVKYRGDLSLFDRSSFHDLEEYKVYYPLVFTISLVVDGKDQSSSSPCEKLYDQIDNFYPFCTTCAFKSLTQWDHSIC